jgi:hypothetical protein
VAAIFSCAASVFLFALPDLPRSSGGGERCSPLRIRTLPARVKAMLVVVTLLLAANVTYQVNLALFVTRDLQLDKAFLALVLALGCVLEVPSWPESARTARTHWVRGRPIMFNPPRGAAPGSL